jgi:hypothetical protein
MLMSFFTDFFQIPDETIEEYGALNISLINDLPLFIDPFLLYGSKKPEYKKVHTGIIQYLTFLKAKSEGGGITAAQRNSWYKFSEVKQNWLGYSIEGNKGSGLGDKFAKVMSKNMHIVFADINKEKITTSSHIEKAGLFQIGVGKDNISDFTCNLIKEYLLEFTEGFALKYLRKNQVKKIRVNKAYFDYELERWQPKEYSLPICDNDYIILTPKDLLTKDDNWINSHDLKGDFLSICSSIPNDQLRSEIHTFFRTQLPPPTYTGKGNGKKQKPPSRKEFSQAVNNTVQKFPIILNYYIKGKEENKEGAKTLSHEKVKEVEVIFKENVSQLIKILAETSFYKIEATTTSFDEAMQRVEFLKDVIENKDGYRLFYYKKKPIHREADLQVIYRLTWYSSSFDVNREVNNGRGPVDYTVSKGAKDKTLVEFKLASNNKLKMNLENQVKIYQKASNSSKSIKVILYFDTGELKKVQAILKELKLEKDNSIVLIDARNNKPSASNAKSIN